MHLLSFRHGPQHNETACPKIGSDSKKIYSKLRLKRNVGQNTDQIFVCGLTGPCTVIFAAFTLHLFLISDFGINYL